MRMKNRGFESENIVLEYALKKGLKLIRQRWKTPFAELDLVFKSANQDKIIIIEVKTNSHEETLDYRLGAAQRDRILRASLWLRYRQRRPVDCYLALVKPNKQIILLNFDQIQL